MSHSFSATRIFGALLFSVTQLMSANMIQFQSKVTATPLLELYTSEGCSSCPPAEAWLSRLKESPKLWRDFVPVAFHVDYWDYLGWRDRFAAKAYTQRQHDYAALWRSRSVYTPGFVLDGKEWHSWFNRVEVPLAAKKSAGVLTARSENGRQWTLRFQPAAEGLSSAYDFNAVLLGFDLKSDVKVGENQGRVLPHDFVVLSVAQAAATKDGDGVQGSVSFNSKLTVAPRRLALAAWITLSKDLLPVQTLGGWLALTNRSEE